jgi:hypothetical protein
LLIDPASDGLSEEIDGIENLLIGIGIPDRPIKLLGINRQCDARRHIPRHPKDSFKAGKHYRAGNTGISIDSAAEPGGPLLELLFTFRRTDDTILNTDAPFRRAEQQEPALRDQPPSFGVSVGVRRESNEVVLPLGSEIDCPGFQPQDVQTVMGGDEQAAAVGAINREPLTQQV